MARTKWFHVYDDDNDGKYVGFFTTKKDCDAWIKKQGKGRNLRVSDVRPQQAEEASK